MANDNVFINTCESLLELAENAIKEKPIYTEEKVGSLFPRRVEQRISFPMNDDFRQKIDIAKKSKIRNSNISDFLILWDYCEFIRWCEKLFLYTNNPTDKIYSDTPRDAVDVRTLLFNEDGYTIAIVLKMSQKADFDSQKDQLLFHNITEIMINRSYGKEIKNKYSIVDGNVRFNDNSDKILLDMINHTIFYDIRQHYNNIIDKISKYELNCKINYKE